MALAALALWSCGGGARLPHNGASAAASASPTPAQPTYRLFETAVGSKTPFVKNYEHGALVYSLKATGVTFTSARRSDAFTKSTIYFYKGSAVRLTVTAPSATVDGITSGIVMRGGVRALSSDGTTLTADTMTYNGKSKLLHAYGHVTATGTSGMVVTGDRAKANLDLQTVDITGGPVTGTLRQ